MTTISKKFDLNYRIEITNKSGQAFQATPPLACQFQVANSLDANTPSGEFILYGLKESNRSFLYRDWFDTSLNTLKDIVFSAGYGNDLFILQTSKLWYGYSEHVVTDWRTHLDARFVTTGFDNYVSTTISKDSIQSNAITGLNATLQKQGITNIINPLKLTDVFKRPYSVLGTPWNILQEFIPNSYIDRDGKLRNYDDGNTTDVLLITSETGLTATPKRQEGRILLEMLFEPSVDVGQVVRVESLDPEYNGNYVVVSLEHSGFIGNGVENDAKTNIEVIDNTEFV